MRFPENAGTAAPFQMGAVLVTVLWLCLLGGCGQAPSEKAPAEIGVVEARLQTLEPQQLPVYAVFPGTVVSADRIEVASRLSGYIQGLAVYEGQSVKEGRILFTVDSASVKAEIRQAKAELSKAKATLAEAESNYRHYNNLYQSKSATRQEYEEAERMYKVAQGSVRAAEAGLANTRTQLNYAEVRAPFDALVVSKRLDNGQLVSPGTPVLVLENPKHLQVQAQVSKQAFSHLRLGQKVQVEFQGPDNQVQTVTGAVERMVSAADPVTHTHLVKVGLPAAGRAYIGEYALVEIPVGEQEGIVVPTGAIYDRAGITGVFVLDGKGRARFRMVTLGRQLPQETVILSGLFPGDRLIVSPAAPLANGVKIQAPPEER